MIIHVLEFSKITYMEIDEIGDDLVKRITRLFDRERYTITHLKSPHDVFMLKISGKSINDVRVSLQ